ncbi:MAG: autotransporter outer membrane beta-barrel domain-containing protein [Pseudomonadota bacterium]
MANAARRFLAFLIGGVCTAAVNTQAVADNISTMSAWNGSLGLTSWGFTNTETFGQVISATGSQHVLQSFTFQLQYINGAAASYQAYVYAWDGTKAVGPALYTSGPLVAPTSGSYVPVTINTGGVGLTPGQQYVLFFTTTTQSNPPGIAYRFGAVSAAAYAAGRAVYQNNAGGGFAALTTTAWTIAAINFAFTAETQGFEILGQNNARGVGVGIQNALNGGAALPSAFNALFAMTPAQVNDALNSLSGEAGAAVVQTGLSATTQFMNAMFDTAFDNSPNDGGASAYAADGEQSLAYAASKTRSRAASEAYAAVTPRDRVVRSSAGRWSTWAAGYGGTSRTSGDASAGSSTNNSRIWGVVAGANYQASADTRVGFAIGGGGYNFGLDSGFGSGRADTFQLGVYAKHNIGPAYVAAGAAYTWQDVTTDRTVNLGGTETYRASFNPYALSGRLEAGWRVVTGVVNVTPYAALQATAFYMPSYGETVTSGTGVFALNYASHDVTAMRSELGARWDKSWVMNGGAALLFKARTAWAFDWQRDRSATPLFQALPGSAFTVYGAAPAANAALVSVGGGMKFRNGWTALASYEGEFSSNTVSNIGKGTLKYEW